MAEGESEELVRCSFAIDVEHAQRFADLRKAQGRAMAEWARDRAEESRGQITMAQARLEARRRRSELWPTLDQHVVRALRKRLAEEDLAGPWEPLTAEEEMIAALSGRGVGKNYPGYLATRAYNLPVSLHQQLRTASIRVSEEPLKELEEKGLLYATLLYDPEDYLKREELVEEVMSVPRIVRQALERYGPWPPDEYPPSSLSAGLAAHRAANSSSE